MSRNIKPTRYAANLQSLKTPDSIIALTALNCGQSFIKIRAPACRRNERKEQQRYDEYGFHG